MSSYAPESPAYSRPYWSEHAPGSVQTPAPSQSYPPPPPPPAAQNPPSRLSFSHHSSAEPLPPLRPPRARLQSIQDESMVDPSLRTGPPQPPSNGYSSYYPTGGVYQHGYAPPPPPDSLQGYLPRPGERMHQSSQQHQQQSQQQQGYMGSPPPPGHTYHGNASPTFGSMQLGGQPITQSPQEQHQQGLAPNPAFRHRSTGSGSGPMLNPSAADANSKYRKLQPAPVPAHRNWASNKPELKTIPYDHKDSAALPNSGPTLIRGWNVNPTRRRPRSDRRDNTEAANERDDSQ
jgi:hypothetical protein